MIQVDRIRNNREEVVEGLRKRNWSDEKLTLLDSIVSTDDKRKKLKTSLDQLNADNNKLSKEIGNCYKSGKREEAEELKAKVHTLKEETQKVEDGLRITKVELEDLLLQVPNVPNTLVPSGNTEEDNEVFKDWDQEFPDLHEAAKPHWELMEQYDMVDFNLGVKITGAGFPLYRGKGAKLQRALINFFVDEAIDAGYEEIIPPLVVNADSAKATGQLPDKEGQMYHIEKDELYLIPTAEVPITNILRGNILSESDFPIKFCGHTPCFRREAGSYGAHVKGLNRVHQFDKIEIVQVAHPNNSYDVLTEMKDHVASLLEKLELPYRILRLCGGDLSFTSAITYDFEVYSAAQKRWLEVSSVSNFETYQSNRMKLRYKDADGKTHLAHTLNGSALALARIFASILENHQTQDGIVIPQALRNYTHFDVIK